MKSRGGQFEFHAFTAKILQDVTARRDGETKLGEKILVPEQVAEAPCRYVVLGISEDIGPQSNGGLAGSTTAFSSFLKRFLNIQSNEYLPGGSVAILGEIVSLAAFGSLSQGKAAVAELDDFVTGLVSPYVQKGLIPIVIGGGHNNAYPLIRAVSQSRQKAINVINLDPHADFRPLEGRHSGNPFSYAFHDGFLDLYAVVGLHQSYNSQFILDELRSKGMIFSFFDDYLSGKADFDRDLELFAEKIRTAAFGIELDMDSIAYMPSSAFSPSGMTLEQARRYVLKMAASEQVAYLHLPEAAPKDAGEEAVAGKALAYLVADFIKAHAAR